MTAQTAARPALAQLEAAFSVADTEEWLHGRNCRSLDCQACRDLMDATNRAADAVARARREMGASV